MFQARYFCGLEARDARLKIPVFAIFQRRGADAAAFSFLTTSKGTQPDNIGLNIYVGVKERPNESTIFMRKEETAASLRLFFSIPTCYILMTKSS